MDFSGSTPHFRHRRSTAFQGGIGRLLYQGRDYDLFYLRKDSVHLSVKWTLRVHLSGGTSFNLPVQNTRYFVLCKFWINIVSIFISLTFRLEFKFICKAERTIKLPNKTWRMPGMGRASGRLSSGLRREDSSNSRSRCWENLLLWGSSELLA